MRITMMCLRNLLRRRLRTLLCILGIALAIMFIVAIGATTTRYTAVIKEMNIFFGGDVVVVARGVIVVQAFPIGGALQESIVGELKLIKGVHTAVPMLFIIPSKIESAIQFVPRSFSIGIPAGNWSVLVGSTPLNRGGSWPSADLSEKEVVVGPSLSDEYGLTINSKIKIETHNLNVVGILETRSAVLSRSVIMPLKLAQDVYRYNMMINMVIVKPEKGVTEAELAERIKAEIGSVEALTDDERNKFVQPFLSEVETWNFGMRSVLFFLSMILVTIVAMMNVSERRRDFATLDAIGAPKSSIFRMIITETSLMGLFGGLVGILLGAFAALLIASFYTDIPIALFFPSLFDIVSPTFMIEILASAVVVGCVAGVIPAIAATRMSITEVLRAEY